MIFHSLCFFIGTAFYCLCWFPHNTIHYFYFISLLGLGLLFIVSGYYLKLIFSYIGCFLIGLLWASIYTQWQVPPLDPYLINHRVEAIGTITSIPEQNEDKARFEFHLEKILKNNKWYATDTLVRLYWFKSPVHLFVGQSWQLLLHVKKARGFANPNGFDYENWLLRQGIIATGYVVNNEVSKLQQSFKKYYWLSRTRQIIAEKIDENVHPENASALIKALTVGVRNEINQNEWDLFRATGTNHLMAIAGLHIGMLVSIVYLLISWCWCCIPSFCLRIPAPKIASVAALFSGLMYAGLAGFSIPTQRAFIMLSVFVITQLLQRPAVSWRSISIALFLIVIRDPLASMDSGFYLSFGAVSFIAYGMQKRVFVNNFWWRHGRIQWVVTLGLMPLSVWLFQSVSWSGIFANAVAIPWVGLIIIPLNFLALPFLFFSPSVSHFLLSISSKNLLLLILFLKKVTVLFGTGWQYALPNPWLLIPFMLGILLLLAPHGWPSRWQVFLLFMPLFYIKENVPQNGEVWFTVLDVGQGLATVVRTTNHLLIYDTGPKFSESFDAGGAVVSPFLHQKNIHTIDALVVSHGDNDHSGGAENILNSFQVRQLYTSVPKKYSLPITQRCIRGQNWQWDNVKFEFLHPGNSEVLSGNNRSCVLRVSAKNGSILLTGDIERKAENELLEEVPANKLRTDILVVPHHGSKTSSSLAFVKAVMPRVVLFSTGYLNRYHFPSALIVNRYSNTKSLLANTAEVGAINIKLGCESELEYYRDPFTNKKGSFMLPLRLPNPF